MSLLQRSCCLPPTDHPRCSMIDRLFAMWQTLYPHSYITNEVSATASYTIHKGAVLGPDTRKYPRRRISPSPPATHQFTATDISVQTCIPSTGTYTATSGLQLVCATGASLDTRTPSTHTPTARPVPFEDT